MCDLPVINEKMSLETIRGADATPPMHCMVKDFGWPTTSPRYRGDHTQESNPDWAHDPMQCPEAKEEAMRKMEVSYALYMANMAAPTSTRKTAEKKDGWTRYMPWKWTARREVAAI